MDISCIAAGIPPKQIEDIAQTLIGVIIHLSRQHNGNMVINFIAQEWIRIVIEQQFRAVLCIQMHR
ncbi:hypothetical protein D3C75_1225800 [compost metagenome]